MSAEFWLGALSLPVGAVALVLCYLAISSVLTLIGNVGAKMVRLTPETTEANRAAFGAVAYSSQRSWFVAFGDLGIAVFAGQDVEKRAAAAGRLEQRRSISRLAGMQAIEDELDDEPWLDEQA